MTLLAEGNVIRENNVRQYFGTRLGSPMPAPAPAAAGNPEAESCTNRPVRKLEEMRREEITYALKVYHGNVPEAAMALGMGRATLYKYIRANNLPLEESC